MSLAVVVLVMVLRCGATLAPPSGPIIAAIPDKVVTTGRNATFVCNVTSSSGSITYTWLAGATSLSDGIRVLGSKSDTLTIVGVTDGDEDQYSCNATDNVTTATSNSALLTAVDPPVLHSINNEPVTIGATFAAACDASASEYPGVTLRWETSLCEAVCDRITTIPYPNGLLLIITDVGTAEDGEYTCVASNPDGAETRESVTLTIIGLPMLVEPLPLITEVEYGETLMLTCIAMNAPNVPTDLSFMWLVNETNVVALADTRVSVLNDQEVNDEARSRLTVTGTLFSDSGNYSCLVHNRQPQDGIITTTEVTVVAYPPSIVEQPADREEVSPGAEVVFALEANGTVLSYQWQRNGSDLLGANTSTLTISNVTEADEALYRCVVTNIIGENVSSSAAQLTVLDPPSIVTHPRSQHNVIPGTDVSLSVGTRGLFLTFLWLKNGTSILATGSSRILGADNFTLTIVGVLESDEGNYSCVVTNDAGAVTTADAVLTVFDLPTITIQPQTKISILPGDNVTFAVGIIGMNISFSWELANGDPLPEDGRFHGNNTDSLTITSVRESDEGGYLCIVTNPAGEVVTDAAFLDVFDPPSITLQPQNETNILPGSNVTFIVAASGMNLSFFWDSVSGNPLPTDVRFSGRDTDTLTILSTVEADEGGYWCSVSNPAGTVLSDGAYLTVYDPPIIIVHPEDQLDSTPRTDSSFAVVANGTDLAYTWKKDGIILPESEKYLGTKTSTLTITDIREVDEGLYACTVSNLLGNTSSSEALLTVFDLPVITQLVPGPAPVSVERGDSVTFSCNGTGLGTLAVTWFTSAASQLLTNIHEMLGDNTIASRLSLSGIDVANGGFYTCQISNEAGSANATAGLYIIPDIVSGPSNISTSARENRSLECLALGYPEPSYSWEKQVENLEISGSGGSLYTSGGFQGEEFIPLYVTSQELSFQPVGYDDFGVYRCVVENVAGARISNEATLTVSPSRSVVVSPKNAVFDYGDSVILSCTARGGPDNVYHWLDNHNSIVPGNILPLTGIEVSSGGNYTCVVSNKAGNGSSTTSVFVSPRIIHSPLSKDATNGSVISLVCEAEAFPEPRYEWFYSDGTIGDNIAPTMSGKQLAFNPVLFGDEGKYYCTATSNNITVLSESATVTVSPEGGVDIVEPFIIAEFDEVVNFACEAQGGPGNSFHWQRNGMDISNETSPSLVVNVTRPEDGGEYTCLVSNNAGNHTDTAMLYIVPWITTEPVNVQTRQGLNESFTCMAEGFPAPAYRWQYLQATDNNRTTSLASNETVLSFVPVIFGDEGFYSCVAFSEPVGDVELTAESESVSLTVSPEDSVLASPEVQNASRNEAIEFTCTAMGGPMNVFEWTRTTDGEVLSSEPVLVVLVDSAEDGSDYECFVGNNAGNETAQVRLNVAPLILTFPEAVNVTSIQDDITLICNASGFPIPQITWTHNSTEVNDSDDRVSITEDQGPRSLLSTLTVTTAMTNDSGQYECIVTSPISAFEEVRSGPVTVLVQDRPERPLDVRATEVNSRNLTLEWVEPHDNNAPIQGYRVTYSQPPFLGGVGEIEQVTIEMAKIIGLHPGVRYNFIVVAFNEIDDSDPSDVAMVTTLEEEPADYPQNVTATVNTSTSVLVTWSMLPEVSRHGIITHYEVLYVPLMSIGGQVPEGSVNTTDGSELSVLLEGLQEDVQYNISVRASTSVGGGPSSPDITVQTPEDRPSSPPQTVEAVANSSMSIVVSWTEIRAIDRNGEIIMYQVQYTPLETFGVLETNYSNTTSGSELKVVLRDLEEDVSYNISVRAYTRVGAGPFSSGVVATTFQDVPSGPPTDLQANVTGSTTIFVSWEEVLPIDQNGNITHYEVQYQPLETFNGLLHSGSVNTTTTIIHLAYLEENVNYSIGVRAYTPVGFGPYTSSVTLTTEPSAPSSPPQNVTAASLSPTVIAVSWEPVPAIEQNGVITQYEVEYNQTQLSVVPASLSVVVGSMMYSVNLTGLEEGVNYTVRVRAATAAGNGPYSAAVAQSTIEDLPFDVPQNITTSALSSTSVLVTWDPVPEIDQNGDIIVYEVRYDPLETFGGQISTGYENTTNGSVLEVTLRGLEEYVEYNISIRAYTEVGAGPFSVGIVQRTDEDLPAGHPQNLLVTSLSSTEIQVFWDTFQAIDQNGIIVQYEVRYEPLETFAGQLRTEHVNTTDGSTLGITLAGLQEFVEYNVSVRAHTSIGGGPYSPEVIQRTSEDTPSLYPQDVETNSTTPTSIHVSWKAIPEIEQNGVIVMYEVRYEPLETFDGNITTGYVNSTSKSVMVTALEGLEEYVEYNISVRAYTTVGAGPFSPGLVQTTLEAPPSEPPQGVRATVLSSSVIRVYWEEVPPIHQNGAIVLYEVEYNQSQFLQSVSLTVSTANVTIVLESLHEAVLYSMRVTALTSQGHGPYTEAVFATTLEDVPSGYPHVVRADRITTTSMDVSWSEIAKIDQNGIITTYEIRYTPLVTFSDQLTTKYLNTTNGSVVETSLEGLQEYVEYNVSVRAYTSVGAGPYSPDLVQRTLEDAPSGLPQTVWADSVNSTSVIVTWNEVPPIDQNGIIIAYEVKYTPLETFGGQLREEYVNTSDATVLEVLLTNLEEHLRYNISVRAYTIVGNGPFSPVITEQTPEDAPSSYPQSLHANSTLPTTIEVSWEEVPPIDQNGIVLFYEIRYEPLQTFLGQLMTQYINTTAKEIILVSLQEYVEYSVGVRAHTSGGTGPFSPKVMQRTPEDVPTAAPRNLVVVTAGPNELNVSWNRPVEIDINGELRYYIVEYQNVDEVGEPTLTTNVTGDMTFVMLEGLNNFTNYSVTVAAFTIDQPGPYHDVTIQPTDENVPGMAPESVLATNLSSTSIYVQWEPLPQQFWYGILRGYIIRYAPVQNFSSDSVYETTELIPLSENSYTLGLLMEFVNYSIQVAAVTIGSGPFSEPVYVQTNTAAAGPVPLPPVVQPVDISYTAVRVSWDPPPDPNGIIQSYTVNFVLLSTTLSPESRRKRTEDIAEECVVGGVESIDRNKTVGGHVTSTTLEDLTPFSVYEFRVQAATDVGPGLFSPARQFSTLEHVPTEPLRLSVMHTSSTSMSITWEAPHCDYGIRTKYTVSYETFPDSSDGNGGTPTSPHDLPVDSTALEVKGLSINTEYRVSVSAYTATGQGEESVQIARTDEDAPPAVVGLTVRSARQIIPDSTVVVTVEWSPTSNGNGDFYYNLTYTADQSPDYPQERGKTSGNSLLLPESRTEYTIVDGLPYAVYSVTITAINVKYGLPGPSAYIEHRSIPIESTAVTELDAIATSYESILVTWNLPVNPNGPIDGYRVFYRVADTAQSPPISSEQYSINNVTAREFKITGLIVYTNYAIHVQPFGNNGNQLLLGAIDKEVLLRTHEAIPSQADFQLRLIGDILCEDWLESNTEEKRGSIVFKLVIETERVCDCGFTSNDIDPTVGGFMCLDDQTAVVFQGRLYSTKTAAASEVVFAMQRWVTGAPSVSILGVDFEVDPVYPVPTTLSTGTDDNGGTQSDAIIGGTIAVVVFNVLVAAALVAGVVLWIRCHRRKPPKPSLGPTIRNPVHPPGIELTDCSAYGSGLQREDSDEYESMAPGDASSVHSNIYDTISATNIHAVP